MLIQLWHLNFFVLNVQDQFHRHLLLEAERKQLRPIIENKSRIILVHTTSGYKYALLSLSPCPSSDISKRVNTFLCKPYDVRHAC